MDLQGRERVGTGVIVDYDNNYFVFGVGFS